MYLRDLLFFQEMIVPTTPLSAMAATPRIDLDNKYTYNHVLAKVIFFSFYISHY